ncbi:MAG TPA: succinate dehydrogenase [Candidatus Limnocylindria bacterium]|nr:succinate dehydrogenase [Candidatus Limnocylindria bacterium]
MSVGRRVWPVQGDPLRRNPSRAAIPRPEEPGRDRLWWYFMRISGLLLVLLALGHMFIMHVMVELTGGEINFAFVTSRWGTPFWRIYDGALLLLAMVHGVRGARIVITDYTHGGFRTFLVWLLVAVTAVWLVLGLAVIVLFDPNAGASVGPFS